MTIIFTIWDGSGAKTSIFLHQFDFFCTEEEAKVKNLGERRPFRRPGRQAKPEILNPTARREDYYFGGGARRFFCRSGLRQNPSSVSFYLGSPIGRSRFFVLL